jgi:hypothetical protein
MATKPIRKHAAPNIALVSKPADPLDRIAAAAERLVTMLFERDREALDREQKLREKALEIVQKIVEKRPGDDLVEMLNAFVKEASSTLGKVVEIKKLAAMSSKGFPRKASRTA